MLNGKNKISSKQIRLTGAILIRYLASQRIESALPVRLFAGQCESESRLTKHAAVCSAFCPGYRKRMIATDKKAA